ncbi:hypothetical protein llap_17361 [Limosa lapponica baueri]|uniref:Adhesion G protein-coupled receptor B N-terminal domain-containing protein n=1 Tax=Limosa lapponica baueri TaxID=1758121 RepID=A0A2I0TEV7_LIMLA|nr:hypothetical protein llap_17361 [Limosa lapponica baueri]
MFGFNAAQDFWCSTLVKGVIYGSYSVSEMFPKNFTNCTWTLENPDPTKYSIYLKFSKKDLSCSNFSLLAYQFDHFSHEKIKDLLKNNHSIMQLCDSKNAFVFLQYDKNFIQIRRVYPVDFPGSHKKEDDQKSFFEFLVLNKVSPSQFGCHVLCTWLESCLKSENGRTESCGIMYTKCTCPQHLGEWGVDDQSLVLLNNVVLPLNEQTEGCLTQELQTTQVCNLTREAKRPPKEGRCFLEGGVESHADTWVLLPALLGARVHLTCFPLQLASRRGKRAGEDAHSLMAERAAFSFLNRPKLRRIVLLRAVETPHK